MARLNLGMELAECGFLDEQGVKLIGTTAEIEKIKSDYAFDASLKEAIRKASGRNEKAIMALLDVDTLKASKNQAQDIEAAITTLKKDNDYLFQQTTAVPRVVSSTTGINNDAQTKKEQKHEEGRNMEAEFKEAVGCRWESYRTRSRF